MVFTLNYRWGSDDCANGGIEFTLQGLLCNDRLGQAGTQANKSHEPKKKKNTGRQAEDLKGNLREQNKSSHH